MSERYRKFIRLVYWAHVLVLWTMVAVMIFCDWRPLGTLDIFAVHVDLRTTWTPPSKVDEQAGKAAVSGHRP